MINKKLSTLSGDSTIQAVYPLFQGEDGGSIPTSPLQLIFSECNLKLAKRLNKAWHSRLPNFNQNMSKICYVATYDEYYYAVAIWSNPSSPQISNKYLELKRLAISPHAPKNTASRMISYMVKDIRKKFPDVPKLISYQDPKVHSGTVYKASGWICEGIHNSGGFSSAKCRYRPKDQASGPKIRWVKELK